MSSLDIARDFISAVQQQEANKAADLCSEEVEVMLPGADQPLRGKEGVRQMIRLAPLGNPAPTGMAAGVIASLLNAWVLAVLALNLGGTTIADGAMLGLICWLGFMATITAAEVAFLKQSWGLWVLNNIHNVIVQ